MRLTEQERTKFIQYSKQYFGRNIHLYLFGSRVYDEKKGGDIDLFLDSDKDIDIEDQIAFLKEIYISVTQRKVDFIIKSPSKKNRPIFQTAKKEGVLLC